jgi:hypothetical protein
VQPGGKVSREDVAAIVDRFLSNRNASQPTPVYNAAMRPTESPAPVQPMNEIDPNWVQSKSTAAPHAEAAPTAEQNGGNGGNGATTGATAPGAPPPVATTTTAAPAAAAPPQGGNAQAKPAQAQTNGHKAVEFVSEDDVRRAVQKGEKIYVNAKTIITPSARDIGEPAEIFAKV